MELVNITMLINLHVASKHKRISSKKWINVDIGMEIIILKAREILYNHRLDELWVSQYYGWLQELEQSPELMTLDLPETTKVGLK